MIRVKLLLRIAKKKNISNGKAFKMIFKKKKLEIK